MPHDVIGNSTFAFAGLVAASGAGYYGSRYVKQLLAPSVEESFIYNTLPFERIDQDQCTLISKEGVLTRVYELTGKNYSALDLTEIENLRNKRRMFFDDICENVGKVEFITQRMPKTHNTNYQYSNDVLQAIHQKSINYIKKNIATRSFVIVSVFPETEETEKGKSANKSILEDRCSRIISGLRDYGCRLLTNEPNATGYSDLLSMWATMVNGEIVNIPCNSPKDISSVATGITTNIAKSICRNDLEFIHQDGYFVHHHGAFKKYGAVISLAQYGDNISFLMRELHKLPHQMVIYHQLEGFSNSDGKKELETNQKAMASSNGTDKQLYEFKQAHDILQEELGSLWRYSQSVIVYAGSIAELEQAVRDVLYAYNNAGCNGKWENVGLEYIWRSQFPSDHIMVRPAKLLSGNLSHLFEFISEPTGTEGNAWGEGCLRLYPTVTGSAYRYNVHKDTSATGVGHHIIIAPTGSGKSTSVMHNMAGAMRYHGFKGYIFDKQYGCRMFTEAIGGKHIDFSKGDLALNPFTLPDNEGNRSFLNSFVAMLAGFDAVDNSIAELVSAMFSYSSDLRVLRDRVDGVLRFDDKRLGQLRSFADGYNSTWFNGVDANGKAFDSLDLSSSDLVTFELGDLFTNKLVCPAMIFYIIRKIMMQSQEKVVPHWIFIDEASYMLRDKVFRSSVRQLLEQIRRNKGVVSLAFQTPNSINNLAEDKEESAQIKQTILTQCTTSVIFPFNESSGEISEDDFAAFNLTSDELDFVRNGVRNAKLSERYVLVKKPNDSVILDINLGYLGEHLKIYDNGSKANDNLNSYKERYQDKWLEYYLKQG